MATNRKGQSIINAGDVFAAPTGEAVTVTRTLPFGRAEIRIQGGRGLRVGETTIDSLRAWPKIGRAEPLGGGSYHTSDELLKAAKACVETASSAPDETENQDPCSPRSSL